MATADLTVLREQILVAIRELAGPGADVAPTLRRFVAESGFGYRHVRRVFGSYEFAVREAGLSPAHSTYRLPREEALRAFGQMVRERGQRPTFRQFTKWSHHSSRSIIRLFGAWEAVNWAFQDFARHQAQWRDVIELLDPRARATLKCRLSAKKVVLRPHGTTECPTCGEQIDFRAMRHAPINELGVVFLFGMLAGELGFTVDIVRAGFPDCEALRPAGDGKWQRVRIEFEFESRSFPVHGHDPSGCDVLVCWRHNWTDCPPYLEVLELQQLARMGRG